MASRFQLILAIVLLTTAAVGALAIRTWPWPLLATKRAIEATVAAYLAFARWACKVASVGTLTVSGLMILAGWLFEQRAFVSSGLLVFSQGATTIFIIGLPFLVSWMGQNDIDNCKAPQGLPPAEKSQQEADELLHLD